MIPLVTATLALLLLLQFWIRVLPRFSAVFCIVYLFGGRWQTGNR